MTVRVRAFCARPSSDVRAQQAIGDDEPARRAGSDREGSADVRGAPRDSADAEDTESAAPRKASGSAAALAAASSATAAVSWGRWSPDEETRFQEALRLFGRDWASVERHVGTRDRAAVRSHAQSQFVRWARAGVPLPAKVMESGEGYTLSGRPLDPNSAAARMYGVIGKDGAREYRRELAERKRMLMNEVRGASNSSDVDDSDTDDAGGRARRDSAAAAAAAASAPSAEYASAAGDSSASSDANVRFAAGAGASANARRGVSAAKRVRAGVAASEPVVGAEPAPTRTVYASVCVRACACARLTPCARQAHRVCAAAPDSAHGSVAGQERAPREQVRCACARVCARLTWARARSDLAFLDLRRYGRPPFDVHVESRALLCADFHAHLCVKEVIGLLGGHYEPAARCTCASARARACALRHGLTRARACASADGGGRVPVRCRVERAGRG